MKKYIYIAVALLVATFASCQNEDTEISSTYKNDANAVHFSASIEALQTRVNTMGNGDTWENGDMIKVCNISDNALETKKEAVCQYENNNWELIGSNYIVWADGNEKGENTFKAFYPYEDGTGKLYYQYSTLYFDLPADQSSNNSTDDNYIGKADLMMATAKVVKSTEPVNLQFRHLLSKVTVNIIKYNDQYEDTKPSFDKSYFYLNDNPQGYGEYVVDREDPAIRPFIALNENGLQAFTAIIFPYKYKNGQHFFTLRTTDGNYLSVKASGILTTDGLEPGKAYNFDLVVGKNVVSIEKVTVTPWTGNDWGSQEGIADEAYTFKVDNSKIILTSLKEGFTSNLDEKIKEELKKHSKIEVHGPVNDQDVKNLIDWICYYSQHFTIDLSNTTLKRLGSKIFPYRGVDVELVLPRGIMYISPDIFVESIGKLTLDLTKCNQLIMLGHPFNINSYQPGSNYRNIVIKIPSSQKDYVDICNWNATATENGVSYKIVYVD